MANKYLVESFLADEFGLSKREIKLYLILADKKARTIIELSEAANMKRTTVHATVDSILHKGLVTYINKGRGSRRLIMVEPADKLALILGNRRAKIETAEQQLSNVMQELASLTKKTAPEHGMGLRRYRGKDEVKLIYEDVLKANKIRTYANTSEMLKIFPDNVRNFVKAHKKNRNMYMWEIMKDNKANRAYIEKMSPKRFSYRLVTESLKLPPTDYFIFDGKVAVIEVARGKISGMVIENKNFYESSKAIHEFVWNYLPDHEK